MNHSEQSVAAPSVSRLHNLRWWICGLLFLSTVINYIDRQVFSILAPNLQHAIGWSQLDYSHIVIAFQVAYAASYVLSGRVLDKIGTKLGYSIAYTWWSLAEIAHAFARTVLGFGIARFFLGLGEAASFPGGMKAIAEWFPESETGLATGLFNSAPTIGGIAAPIVVPLVAAAYGWRGAFILTGALGLVWLVAWVVVYRKPPSHDTLHSSGYANPPTVPWKQLLSYRQTWACVAAKGLADPVWFFYLFWLPLFLAEKHGITGTAIIPYLTTVYVFAGIGSVVGGSATSFLVRRGWSINRSRKVTMAGTAVITPFVIFAANAQSTWTAVLLIAMTVGAHQSWSSLAFNLGPDLFPSKAVGSVIGFAGMVASVTTVIFAEVTGLVLQRNPRFYLPMFIICGFAYMVALIIVHLLSPKLERAPIT
jgi:MFS transporter, ACS family, aldohexuronate transporter